MKIPDGWPHNPAHDCPSNHCHGQFVLLKHVGILCTDKLHELTGGHSYRVFALSDEAKIAAA